MKVLEFLNLKQKTHFVLLLVFLLGCSRKPDFKTFPKIDAHVHLETSDDSFVQILQENNFELMTLVTRSASQSVINKEFKFAKVLHDNHPGCALDMASRIEHFQVQDAERVKEFIIRYQDQLLYATDISLNDEDPDFTISDQVEEVLNRVWLKDWEYFTTSKIIENGSFGKYLCLDLPVSVLEKIYFKNAIKMYPGLERK